MPVAIDAPTTIETAQHLMGAVYKGYGGNFETIKYDTPDYDKLSHLERNVYQFSGAKNWQMLRDLTDALRDGDKVLPYRQFRTKAQTILDDYNDRYLRTEYNAAVAGSQMASKWVEFEKHPDALLEYRTAEDDRVRQSHQVLNGVIRPVSDDFWKTYYPPNGWNCRCTVIRRNSGTATKMADVAYPEVPTHFATNLAENGLVFPKNSAYYVNCPKEVLNQSLSLIPTDRQLEQIAKLPNGGAVYRHTRVSTTRSDYALHRDIAMDYANSGHIVEILGESTVEGVKNPDLRIDGKFVEVKEPEADNYDAYSRNIRAGLKQANHVIVQVRDISEEALMNIARGRLKNKDNKVTITFRFKDGRRIEVKRPDLYK